MKKNLEHKILNMDDTEAMLQPGVPLTIKHCVLEAVLASNPGTTAEEKSRRWGLAQKMRKGGIVNITVDEAALIKSASEIHPVLLYGQIVDWLEKDEDAPQPAE